MTLLGTAGCNGGDAGAAPAAVKTTLSGSADQQCLVGGSPWKVSTADLASTYKEAVRGADVKEVRVDGDQTLTVTPDLHVTILDETTTTISARMNNGADLVVTQQHTGSTGGQWKVSGKILQSTGTWTGGIDVDTSATVDGRDRDSPVKVPADTIGKGPLTFSCADGTLKLTAKGSSFGWLLN
jgi:hypothetical protein